METKLKNYQNFIKKASSHPTPELKKYHQEMLTAFQHERLIHLIVTMFFALFLIIFFIFTAILFLTLPSSLWGNIFSYCTAFITTILLIVTLFYVRHYYQLENGVQKLEEFTAKLHSF
jgi:phosphoglycerol transferase MdoB-like AlkP superfamily enzyme